MAQGNRCDEGYISTYIYVCIYRVDLCAGEVFSLPTVATAPTGGEKILSKRAQKLASVRKNVVRMKMMIPNMMYEVPCGDLIPASNGILANDVSILRRRDQSIDVAYIHNKLNKLKGYT